MADALFLNQPDVLILRAGLALAPHTLVVQVENARTIQIIGDIGRRKAKFLI